MKATSYKPGQVIFKNGDPADGLYIVSDGQVWLYFPTNMSANQPDITLEKPAIFGEMGVIDNQLRMATARAFTDVTVIFVSRKEFEQRLEGADMVVRGVLGILSERLRDMQRKKIKNS